jgi:two-component system phosphate regulon response regulator PhoB
MHEEPTSASRSARTSIEEPVQHTAAPLTVHDIELDWHRHRLKRGSRDVRLSTLELSLLRFLMTEPSRVFSREEILKGVWPRGINVGARTVDVHIAALRKALAVPSAPSPLRTVRGRGYSLDFDRG